MNMKKIVSVLVFTSCFAQHVNGQTNMKSDIHKIATNISGSNWYIFDKGITISDDNINSREIKNYFGFDIDNSFALIKSDTDDLKIVHHDFQQMYKGIPIQYAKFKIHLISGKPLEANGKFVAGFNKKMPAIISFNEALEFAKKYYPAQVYMWQDTLEETSLRMRTHEKRMTYYPKEELLWAVIDKNEKVLSSSNYSLAYKIKLSGKKPWFSKDVFIDATTGKLMHSLERDYNCGTLAFNTNFNGSKICLYDVSVSYQYKLIDLCGLGGTIYVSDNGSSSSPYVTPNNIPWNVSDNNLRSACSSLWALREAAKYFYYVHNRDGYDDDAGDIDLRQNAEFLNSSNIPYYNNASFSTSGICRVGNNQMAGPGTANSLVSDDYNSFDILAHEFTHGVTFETCDLEYEGESGALNESFSDIFGMSAYQNNGGFSSDSNLWLIGYDRTDVAGNHLPFRNMRDPHDKGDPDTYLTDAFWKNTAATAPDNGGVHSNSGVQNYMYYLLVKGGSGLNANFTPYSMTGIGYIKARAIAYRTLSVGYLDDDSNFPDARAAWVHAAVDLYGYCSAEAIAVGKAWEAVGLNPPNNNSPYCGIYGVVPQSYNNGGPAYISPANCGVNVLGFGNQVSINSSTHIDILPGMNTNSGAFFTSDINTCIYSNY
jgi:bacillolysin